MFEEGEAMNREQAIIKLPGSTEIPVIALDDWKVWMLIALTITAVMVWKKL